MDSKSKGHNIIFPIIFVGLTVLLISIGMWTWQNIKNDAFSELSNATNLLERYYDLTFRHREQSLLTLGQRLEDIQGNYQDSTRQRIINQSLMLYEDFSAIGFADTSGQVMTLTGFGDFDRLPDLSASPDTRRSFEEAKQSNRLVIGEVYYFDFVGSWIIPIRVPIRVDGKLQAVNTSAVSYTQLVENLKSFGFNPYINIHLVNHTHQTTQLYYPLEKDRYDDILHQQAAVYDVEETFPLPNDLSGFSGYSSIENSDVFGVKSNPGYYDHYVVASMPKYIVIDNFWGVFAYILFAYFILTAATAFAYWYFSNTENKYISELQSERDFSTKIINQTPAMIVGLHPDLSTYYINPTAEKTLGYSVTDEPLDWWRKTLKLDQSDPLPVPIQRLKEDELSSFICTNYDAKGHPKTISWNSVNIYNKELEVEEILLFGNDQTEKEKALQQVKEREANMFTLIESTQSIIGLFDKEKRLIIFNKAFDQYARNSTNIQLEPGMAVVDTMEEPYRTLFHGYLDRSLKGEKLRETVEFEGNGRQFYFLFNYHPIYQDEEIVGVSMFVEDITELKKSEEQLKRYSEDLEAMVKERTQDLQESNHRLKEINEELSVTLRELKETQNQLIQTEKMASLGILSAGIGHEINNPLNFIKNGASGLATILENQSIDEKETIDTFINIIHDGVKRASEIVKSLSHFSRSGENMDESCQLEEIIDNSLTILQSRLKHKVEIIKSMNHDEAPVTGNSGKLHQAILNILSNAEQAIKESGTISIKTRTENQEIVLEISDDGIGIPKSIIGKISDPFFTTKDPGEGTGLGLSITYSIIKDHKGRITVSSKKNKGTIFTVYLPT